ncbi:MAG: AarF/UbiB family protein, partial [Pseudomonadota bacterium]
MSKTLRVTRTLLKYRVLPTKDFPFAARCALWVCGLGLAQSHDARTHGDLATAMQSLGPSFIKLGQALSIRPDIIGKDRADNLRKLQDRMPPFSGKIAREIITRELHKPIDELFQNFDDQAIAAASIAQVHRAITTRGEHVAVKILRPDIEQNFAKDIAWMRILA